VSGRDRLHFRLFGVVLAGGQSRRYGGPKARARLAGVTLLERALAILQAAGLETGVIANRAEDLPAPWSADAPGDKGSDARPPGGDKPDGGASARPPDQPRVPVRSDLTPGAGPLAGLHAGLTWARERGDAGVFLLGCDLPLVPPALVARLATGFDAARPTVPASPGPLGIEPLCACYPVGLTRAAEEWLAAGRFGMGEFVRAHDPVVVAGDKLALVAGAEHAFLNVNAPADLDRAADLLSRQARPD
jgi:molybdopterin-guanine dinucleotide biosynthesis protein A